MRNLKDLVDHVRDLNTKRKIQKCNRVGHVNGEWTRQEWASGRWFRTCLHCGTVQLR